MREILFKAKVKNNNGKFKKSDWVEGDLVRITDGNTQKWFIYGKGEVDPETVCQFTGSLDKNGNKIFEGDICRFYNDDGETSLYAVEWDQTECGFIVRYLEMECDPDNLELDFAENCEVIGNVFDRRNAKNE